MVSAQVSSLDRSSVSAALSLSHGSAACCAAVVDPPPTELEVEDEPAFGWTGVDEQPAITMVTTGTRITARRGGRRICTVEQARPIAPVGGRSPAVRASPAARRCPTPLQPDSPWGRCESNTGGSVQRMRELHDDERYCQLAANR